MGIITPAINTPAQRTRALGKAEAVRGIRHTLRDEVKRRDRAGGHLIADVLLTAPPALSSMYVWQLVQTVPKVRDVKTRAMMRAADIDPWRKVGRLTARQREALAVELRRHAEGLPASPPARVVGVCGFCREERAT